jgi:hypothetical protein
MGILGENGLMSHSNIFGDREIRLNNKIGKSFFNFT